MREALNTSATMAGTCTFIAQVSGTLPVAPNLRPGHEHDVGGLGQLFERAAIQQVGRDRLDARASSASRTPGSLKRATPITRLRRRRALGQARQRRPHLAADAQHEDVAGRPGEIGDQRSDGVVMKSSTASTLSKRSGSFGLAHVGGSAGHRLHRLEVHLGADGEARHVKRAQRQLAAAGLEARRLAGLLFVEIGMARRRRPFARPPGAKLMPSMKWWALRSTWVRPSSDTSARSCCTLTPGQVVRSSADMKWPGAEPRHARGIEDRLVEALAVLARDAGIAELQRRRERRELAVRFIDDHRPQPGQRLDRARQRHGPLDRLLDEQRRLARAWRAPASPRPCATARRCLRRRRTARCRRA